MSVQPAPHHNFNEEENDLVLDQAAITGSNFVGAPGAEDGSASPAPMFPPIRGASPAPERNVPVVESTKSNGGMDARADLEEGPKIDAVDGSEGDVS